MQHGASFLLDASCLVLLLGAGIMTVIDHLLCKCELVITHLELYKSAQNKTYRNNLGLKQQKARHIIYFGYMKPQTYIIIYYLTIWIVLQSGKARN